MIALIAADRRTPRLRGDEGSLVGVATCSARHPVANVWSEGRAPDEPDLPGRATA